MPGILPMKVIKCGSALQSRIAQACDRCRSKKIRCDGISPSCTQCLNVGFECKTSDKLSRRAFPRGYTESLEERVRHLENEIRELKGLLDEKEEKIDMICKVRSGSLHRKGSAQSASRSPSLASHAYEALSRTEEETISIQQPITRVQHKHKAQRHTGLSSVHSLAAAYLERSDVARGALPEINLDTLFTGAKRGVDYAEALPTSRRRLGRVSTDRLVNVFFQELAPLFPVLHRPTILKLYNDFLSTKKQDDHKANAQLSLVFSNAALSIQGFVDQQELASLEHEWTEEMDKFRDDESLVNVQCLTLATLYHLKRGQYSAMLKYLGHAVALCHRLGLNCDQLPFEHDPLTSECRKRTFWTLFTLDSFAAAHTGSPAMIDSKSVHCQYPSDTDDEYITNTEITPSLPGEVSKISSALALFKLSKILSRTLKDVYPSSNNYTINVQTIVNVENDLRSWSDNLAPHLRLRFEQEKPSTHVISDRSPLLSLAYQYVLTLILKPLILSQNPSHDRLTSTVLSLADSSKKVLQINELLEERSMAFAFCLNREDLVVHAIFGLLWQCSELTSDSTLLKESLKLCLSARQRLEEQDCPGSSQLVMLLRGISVQKNANMDDASRSQAIQVSKDNRNTRGIKGIAKGFVNSMYKPRAESQGSELSSASPESITEMAAFDHRRLSDSSQFTKSESHFPVHQFGHNAERNIRSFRTGGPGTNLQHPSRLPLLGRIGDDNRDWQKLLSDLDRGHHNIYDVIYGGPGGDHCSASSVSPEQVIHSNFSRMPTGQVNNQGIWSARDGWNLLNGAPDLDFSITDMALSHSSNESPRLEGYTEIAFPIIIPDESTPSSIDVFDAGWIPELDPLFRISH